MYHYCQITSKIVLIAQTLSEKKWVGLICPVCSVKIVKLTPKLPNTSKLSNYTKIVKLPQHCQITPNIVKLTQIWINWQITPHLLNYHKIVKNLNWRWITAKLSKTWIGLILILNASDHSAVTCGQMGGSWIHTWLQNMYARLH